MKIAIIGCGYSGLSAVRRCLEFEIGCVAFDINSQVGGLWLYNDRVGVDEFGIPIQTSLYESLRTNAPKQNMEFPDFPFQTAEDTCYPHHSEVLRYLQEFAEHFKLLPHIKLRHHVTMVSRLENKWEVEVKNLVTDRFKLYHFDAVMVCNGHTTRPYIPHFNGAELFRGLQLHSHEYRRKAIFTSKNVLIIGFGPSGLEIAHEATFVAKKVYVCYQSDSHESTLDSTVWKAGVKEIQENRVIFSDESAESIDVIVYCTGYLLDFPFLNKSCGIQIKEGGRIVQPLYKHYINIQHPSMCFIGLFAYVIVPYLFDLQVQAFLKFVTRKIDLPSKSVMLDWLDTETHQKKTLNIPPHHYYHLSAETMQDYFKDITEEAKLPNIPPVLFKLYLKSEEVFENYSEHVRRWFFEIQDQYNFKAYFKAVEN